MFKDTNPNSTPLKFISSPTNIASSPAAPQHLIDSIWSHDPSIWTTPDALNWLGWLDAPERMKLEIPRLQHFTNEVLNDGFKEVLLLGMGGSSLSVEVVNQMLHQSGYPEVTVVDCPNPHEISRVSHDFDPASTLFIVSSKSGSTLETDILFRYFYNLLKHDLGDNEVGRHFVAITDPQSSLALQAQDLHFRELFLNDPKIGGRFSALSFFGLAPAALTGVDLPNFLNRAIDIIPICHNPANNPAYILGSFLAQCEQLGKDKLTLITSPKVTSFSGWLEQLIAESLGKDNRGLLPVVGEPLQSPPVYGPDRFFVFLNLVEDHQFDASIEALVTAGFPLVQITLNDLYDLSTQMYLWELGTAVAGSLMGINPFDQPHVEASKAATRKILKEYKDSGTLPQETPAYSTKSIKFFGEVIGTNPYDILDHLINNLKPPNYISFQLYAQASPATIAAVEKFRAYLHKTTGLAVTFGFGPRFHHSTLQFQAGGRNSGVFIQLVEVPGDPPTPPLPIPDVAGKPESSIDFGTFAIGQSLGVYHALLDAGRHLLRLETQLSIPETITLLIPPNP